MPTVKLALKYCGVGEGASLSYFLGRKKLVPGDVYELSPGGVTLGRNFTNDVPLMVNWVSRRHCRVVPTGADTAQLEDLKSTMGTWARGRRLASGEAVELRVGDRFTVSEYVNPPRTTGFEFELVRR